MFVLPKGEDSNEILHGLWLGNAKAAANEVFLKDKNIGAVFNCTKDLPFHRCVKRCYRVPVDDNLQDSEIRNLELWSFEIIVKLSKEYKEGRPVLVHCAMGMQRSAAVIAMFLIAFKNMSAEEAIAFIREKRPIAFMPMTNFSRSIKGFEAALQKIHLESI